MMFSGQIRDGKTPPAARRLPPAAAAAVAGLVPFLIGLVVARQGFNLLDDGLWVLGGKVLSDGGILYRDLFSIYGPARYVLLLPFFWVLGQNCLALAVLKAVSDGVAAGFGFVWARRLGAGRLAWLVPLGVVALGPFHPRYVAAAGFAYLVGLALERRVGWRGGLGIGLAWGLLASFGLDAAGFGGLIVILGALASGGNRPGRATVLGVVVGFFGWLVVLAGLALARGALSAAVWDTVVYPVTRFSGQMGISWLETFAHSPVLRHPFGDLHTGEQLAPAWPGQVWLRATSLRCLLLAVWVVFPLGVWVRWRRSGQAVCGHVFWGPFLALALAGWAVLLGRGELAHLRMAWFGSLLLLPAVVAALSGRRVWRVVGIALACAVLLPLTAEKLWLAAHPNRPGLVTWQRSTARVDLARDRIQAIESIFASLPGDGSSPLLIWPMQPGLHFLMDVPLATAQATLLAGEVRDPAAVVRELEASQPSVGLLGRSWGVLSGVRSVRQLSPELWLYLRDHYSVASRVTKVGNQYLVLGRVAGGAAAVRKLPISQQLADNEQLVANQVSPPLRPGQSVGQSFVVGARDFSGITVRWVAGALPPLEFTARIRLLGRGARGFTERLGSWDVEVALTQDTELGFYSFPPVSGTASREVAVSIELLADVPGGVYLGWHIPLPDQEYEDFYPEGDALVNGRVIVGDLYFLSY